MGEIGPKSNHVKLDNVISFSGATASYPVELFLSVIENEAALWNEPEGNMCKNAWDSIAEDKTSPAGVWKSKRKGKYGKVNSSIQWKELKEDLLDAFGRWPKSPYTFEEKFNFLASLIKAEDETFTAFVSRVKWVMSCPFEQESEGMLAKMVFLLGLRDTHQAYFLSRICLEQKSLADIVLEASETKASDIVPKEEEEVVFEDELDHLLDIDFHPAEELFFKKEEESSEVGEPLPEKDEPLSDTEWVPLARLKKKRPRAKSKEPKVRKKRRGDNFLGKEDSYPCKICGLVLTKPGTLAIHMKNRHVITGCFDCNIKDANMSVEQWDKHESEFHLGMCNIFLFTSYVAFT